MLQKFTPLKSPASPLLGAVSVELDVHDVRIALNKSTLVVFRISVAVVIARYLTRKVCPVPIYSLNIVVFWFSVHVRPLKSDLLALCNLDGVGVVKTAWIRRGVVGRLQNSTLRQTLISNQPTCETK